MPNQVTPRGVSVPRTNLRSIFPEAGAGRTGAQVMLAIVITAEGSRVQNQRRSAAAMNPRTSG